LSCWEHRLAAPADLSPWPLVVLVVGQKMQVGSQEPVEELLRSYIITDHRGNQQQGIGHKRAYAHGERVRICGQKSITKTKGEK